MLRTIVLAVCGLILTVLLAAAATSFMLSHTEFGRSATGDTSGMSDRWQVFVTGRWVLLLYVQLPTVILVAIFAGLLDKKFPSIAALVAVLPISLVGSGLGLMRMLTSLLLLVCAVLVSGLTQRILQGVISSRVKQASRS